MSKYIRNSLWMYFLDKDGDIAGNERPKCRTRMIRSKGKPEKKVGPPRERPKPKPRRKKGRFYQIIEEIEQ